MASSREIVPLRVQGVDEQIAYRIDTTGWGGSPVDVEVKVYDVLNDYTDVTGQKTIGAPSVVDNIITLPQIHSLEAGKLYRVEVKFTSGANVLEPFFRIRAER